MFVRQGWLNNGLQRRTVAVIELSRTRRNPLTINRQNSRRIAPAVVGRFADSPSLLSDTE